MGTTAMADASRLPTPLWNPAERRPRAPVRLALAVVLLVGALRATQAAVALLRSGSPPASLVWVALILAQGVPGVVVLLVAVGVDRRTLDDLGASVTGGWALDFGFGAALGAGLMTAIVSAGLATGWWEVRGSVLGAPVSPDLLLGFARMLAFFAVTAVSEELVARGYLLTNVAEGLAPYVPRSVAVGTAVVVSSQAFAGVHLLNPGATTMSMVGISAVGVLLAVGYVFTRSLAIPIGLHLTWNLFQGTVYGFPVSGLRLGPGLIITADTGPDVLTGGSFGPEAGVLSVAVVLVGVVVTVAYVRWQRGTAGVSHELTTPRLNWE